MDKELVLSIWPRAAVGCPHNVFFQEGLYIAPVLEQQKWVCEIQPHASGGWPVLAGEHKEKNGFQDFDVSATEMLCSKQSISVIITEHSA